ncbi:DUF3325 domain-containing protein [Acidovorax sp.]|uniref:DUF3325 domain-containing protein n=1 Tax=Acidovorax sp. TaxID=1872122 RepID=UPI00391D7D32
MHLVTFALCVAGFTALALATERQQDELFGQPLARKTTYTLRLAGWSAMLLALFAIVLAQGWGMGLVSYSGHTSLAAGVVLAGLIVRSRLRGRA